MTNAIELHNLTKTYPRRDRELVRAVDDLSLSVPAGQIIGFLGANGAGKTTTIKMMCGLVIPTMGHIILNGFDLTRQHSQAMLQIGAVLEGTRNIYWRLSAWQNLIYFGKLKGCWGKILNQRAKQILCELDLWDRRDAPTQKFSRGMQQKVAIGCALIADPPIVLLDEPTLGLDVQAARAVKEWIYEMANRHRKTIVLTTHQLDMAQELCDRIVIIHQGRMIADQPTSQLIEMFRQEHFEIRVEGHLDKNPFPLANPLLKDLSITQENSHIVLRGPMADQAMLHQLLDVMREQNLPLVLAQRVEPTLEDVFVHLTKGNGR